jgi:aminoglycoside phosphotransferase (APT) family kinase protein
LARSSRPEGDFEVLQFPGGHSNLTYCVRLAGKDYVLRRPPFGAKIKSAHDMGREHKVLSQLWRVFDKAPRAVLHCEDEAVLGAEFYLTERAHGVILRRDLPEGVELDEAGARALSHAVVDTLVELHGVDYAAAGLSDLGRPDGFVERQVGGWTKRYAKAKTDDLPDIDTAAAWLASNMPTSPTPSLVHNDYKHDNLVLAPDDLTRVVAVLDWEMCTTGDPLMDLGTTLAYWVEPEDDWAMQAFRLIPTDVPGTLTRAEVVQAYGEKSGTDVSGAVFYYVFGLFKVAVVAQQIYARFAAGHTKDPRFAAFIEGVRCLAAQAARYTGKSSL